MKKAYTITAQVVLAWILLAIIGILPGRYGVEWFARASANLFYGNTEGMDMHRAILRNGLPFPWEKANR